ncbi:MAG TPA: GAF domain-containing protein, partial [Candidatus Deferrimicrobium sp.]|nr:GAF domain-containing protein [Candidatus Deferrimicrobium sp.]
MPITKDSAINTENACECKQTEIKLAYLNRVLRALRNINQLIVQEKDIESLVKSACKYLTRDRVFHRARIALLNEKQQIILSVAESFDDPAASLGENGKQEKLSSCAQKALTQQGILGIHIPSGTCPDCAWCNILDGNSAMTVRLEHDGEIYGILTVSLDAHLTEDEEQQNLFKNIANDIGFALHHIRQEKERRRAEVLQAAVYRISQTVHSTENIDSLYREIHNIICDVMPAENFYIAYYDEKDELLTFPYFVDAVDPPPVPRKTGNGLTEYVLHSGNSLLASLEVQEELRKAWGIQQVGVPSLIWLGVPLKAEEKVIGIIAVQDYKNPQAYGERELHMLEYVSTQVAKAIERKRSEEALRISEDLNRGIVVNTPIGIMYLDKNSVIVYENPAVMKMMKEPEGKGSTVIGKNILDMHGLDDTKMENLLHKVRDGESIHNVEFEYKSLNGENFTLKIHAAPRWGGGKPQETIGAILMCEDITSYKRLEAQFLQAQKMEAVGRLVGGIAHDFNNLLTVIFGHAELAMMVVEETSPVRKHIREIVTIAERTTDLIDQLMAFSRKQVIKPKLIDLNNHLEKIQQMLQRLIGEDVELTFLRKSGLGMVKVGPTQLDQVIVNLVVNARDAMPRGGRLIIETLNVDVDENFAAGHVGSVPGPYVQLSVSDTGHGISPELMIHIFDPFFTTKLNDKGTGLGLSTVYGIIKQNDGFITCYSEPEVGTTFKIYLPRLEAEEVTIAPVVGNVTESFGKETILVVEDDQTVRGLAVQMLRKFGYDVIESIDGSEALELCRQRQKPVDLVLTDVIMPNMSGPELIQQVRLLWKNVKVLYMSGYTENTIINRGIL